MARNKGIVWDDQPLGNRSDAEISKLLGVNKSTVSKARARRGIPRYYGDYDVPKANSAPVTLPSAREVNVELGDTLQRHEHLPSNYGDQPQWAERILFVPDTHAPFHDQEAWNIMLLAAQVFRPTMVVHLGDMADCYSVSTHSRDPKRVTLLEDELCVVKDLLAQLGSLPSVRRKIFIGGNHEDRLRRYLWDKAPALYGLVSIPELLGLERLGWEWFDYGDGTRIGKLYVTHDLGFAGRYGVRRSLAAAGCNIVIGHLHQMCVVYDGSAMGDTHVAACFGWLARADVAHDYKHKIKAMKEYQHGFGLGYMTPDGDVHLRGVPIVNGSCFIEGIHVSASRTG